MRIDEGFRAAYRELEARMKVLAEADGDVFLPNPAPVGPVEYVFVCMEPSLGRWARAAGIVGHEDRFEEFKHSVSLKRVLATAEDVLRASDVPASFRDETLTRLAKSQLSASRQKLIFNYKRTFEAMGSSDRTGLP